MHLFFISASISAEQAAYTSTMFDVGGIVGKFFQFWFWFMLKCYKVNIRKAVFSLVATILNVKKFNRWYPLCICDAMQQNC